MSASRAATPFPYEARFFVARSPLLPAEALRVELRTPEADEAALEAAVAADRAAVEARMRALVALPEVREALWLNSPDLDRALELWLADPAHPQARNVAGSLYRYLARMSRRPTPFGLSAGLSTGAVGPATRLELDGADRSHTRLDMAWLTALTGALEPLLRDGLRYRPNSSLYRSSDQLRYAEARVDPRTRDRKNDQVALASTPAIEAALAAAPARPAELAAAVRARHPEVSDEEALGFVHGLIEAQILVAELGAPITGEDPLGALVDQLAEVSPELSGRLGAAREAIAALDAQAPGRPVETYGAITALLAELPAPPDPRRLYHADLYRGGSFTLGPAVLAAISELVEVLRRITPTREEGAMTRLRDGLEKRFGGGVWPLTDVLDDERGVGYSSEGRSSDPSPLLEGLPLEGRPEAPRVPMGERERWMLNAALRAGPGGEWVLQEADLAALESPGPRPPLPDSLAFMGRVLAQSAEAIDAGDFQLLVGAIGGPSGARLMGRFCLGDPTLRAEVEAHLRAEESWAPEAVFAEVVHSPEGRMGNVLGRPRLRTYEIPYLGQGAAPPEHQLPVEDLLLGFEHGRLRLWSRRLGREVLPRLSSAHNYGAGDLPIYRFLGEAQSDGLASALFWTWGALESLPWLPRVRWKNAVLSPALWHLDEAELRPLLEARGPARVRAARALRASRSLPREVQLVWSDNVLPVDLEDPVALEALAGAARGMARVQLSEALDRADQALRGPDGRHTLEVVVPFVRTSGPVRPSPPLPRSTATRAWMPGSPWLYLKISTGSLTADAVVAEVVAPLVSELRAAGQLERWFFIRYADPDWHLRVRLRVPAEHHGAALAALHEALAPWLADRRIWRLELDTYQPEVERYGGDAGIEPSETLFEADSDAVAAIVALLSGDEGSDARWRLGLRSVHLLLEALDIPLPDRIEALGAWRQGYTRRFRLGKSFEAGLNERYRALQASLPALIAPAWDPEDPLVPGYEILAERQARLIPIVEALRAAPLNQPLIELAQSYAHMAMNRILRAQMNETEMVVYELLARLYKSRLARERAGGSP